MSRARAAPIRTDVAQSRITHYIALTKPKVVALIVFTAIVGMFLATPGMVPWDVLILGSLGIGLAAASGAAVNHVVDRVNLVAMDGDDRRG